MNKRGGLLAVLGIMLLGISFFIVPPVQAQDDGSLNLTTSPLPINLAADPGEIVTTELRIKNSGTSTEDLQVGLLKFGANNESGQPRLADREPGDDYFDWVSFSEDRFTAEPNVWHTITMTINIPPEAALGYYYAVTFTRAQGSDATAQGASLDGGTAVLVLLGVDVPHALRKIEVSEFRAGKSVYEFLPAEFEITLKNSGNIHLIPSGSIFITKGSEEIAVLPVNESRGNVLPDSSRSFRIDWADGFPKYEPVEENGRIATNDDGTAKMRLKWDLGEVGKLRFGKYKATLLLAYDDGQRDVPVEAVLTFWVIPWRIIFIGLLIAAVLLAGLYMIARQIFGFGKKLPKSKKPDKPQPKGGHEA